MLYDLATIHDELDRFEGQEVTVRCRVRSDAMSGDRQGQKTLYEIDDPRGNLDIPAFLSFWTEEPQIPDVTRTAGYVLDTLEEGVGDTGPLLDMGEDILVRGVPKRSTSSGTPRLFLNVTSVVIRSPDLQIGKGEMAVRSQCPRRYYLTFVKKVYNPSFPVNGHAFRGDIVHRAAERAVEEEFERFVDQSWTEDDATEYVETVLDEEFGIRMAQLTISGIGLWGREHAKEIVTRLFTSKEFCELLADADPESVSTERALSDAYGYRGDVDLVVDGTPYDFKTSREVSRNRHARQLQLYLFGLLLEQADVGDDLGAALDTVPEGYLVYPNLEETDSVRFEPVSLTRDDVRELLELRNAVAEARDPFGPPSPYNRDCENCRLRTTDELVSPRDQDRPERDPLPSACKYHCQTERRWPCYEVSADGGTTSDCSLFDECGQRLEYRDPEQVDHYNRLRKALGAEERARRTASDLLVSLDDSVLKRSGRLVEGLSLSNAAMGYASFETDERIVPAFAPGDAVVLEPEKEGSVGKQVTFLGIVDGEYRFQFDVQQHLAFLHDDVTYRVRKTFEPENVSRKFLPYLDYAQRRGHNRRFKHEQEHGSVTQGATVLDDPANVTTHLDNTEVFLDIPVRSDRNSVLGTVVESLATASYPQIDEPEPVPEEGQRALVLGATPEAVEAAERALPDGDHYRMDDGATGERAIRESDSQHEIQRRWRDSRSLLSSVQYALKTEQFHTLLEGTYGNRDHSPRFFDVLVLLSAEELTEAEYLFLSDLADRVVAVGDRRGLGPSMVSSEAAEQGLDRSYFTWAHDRYESIPVDDAVSLQLAGETNEFVQGLYPDDAWEDAQTEFSFLEIEGGELVAADEFEVQASVRARRGVPFELVFDASDTTASPFEIQSMLESRDYLDATELHEGEVALIDERPLFLESKRQLSEETDASHHRIIIKSEPTQTPEFSRAFLYNRPEATIVAQVADEYDAEFVVTPFETHANVLREKLDEQGSEIPVRLPEQLGGGMAGRSIVSFGVSNEHGVLRAPLNEPEMLYRLLSCAEEQLLVGHGPTLRSKRDLEGLVDKTAAEY
jgi:CRISPR/Cas system-associated exonuclease Cas4 (RecB family)